MNCFYLLSRQLFELGTFQPMEFVEPETQLTIVKDLLRNVQELETQTTNEFLRIIQRVKSMFRVLAQHLLLLRRGTASYAPVNKP